ncbi:MAG: glycosyltransferase family 4 protein [Pseudomonadota bacterium]
MSLKICFVGLKCFDLISGAELPKYLGGIEKQLVALAYGFVDAGHQVSFITYDHGQEDGQNYAGIKVFKAYDVDGGIPVMRFIHPRMTNLWAAMRRADADIYVQMGGAIETGAVGIGSKLLLKKKRRFMFCLASDADSRRDLPFLSKFRERVLYRAGLRCADIVIAQTHKQRDMLSEAFARDSTVITMPYNRPPNSGGVRSFPDPARPRVLWVGRIIEVKRLEILLDVAELSPEIQYDVVGVPNAQSKYADDLLARGRAMSNVTMHGKVSEKALPEFFVNASVLCCTSELEGFPTTFLEAWAFGLPIVTTFDPDGVIKSNCLGAVVGSPEQLLTEIRKVVLSSQEWIRISEAARLYFEKKYTVQAVVPQFERKLVEMHV